VDNFKKWYLSHFLHGSPSNWGKLLDSVCEQFFASRSKSSAADENGCCNGCYKLDAVDTCSGHAEYYYYKVAMGKYNSEFEGDPYFEYKFIF
jgi:hypothetical protein